MKEPGSAVGPSKKPKSSSKRPAGRSDRTNGRKRTNEAVCPDDLNPPRPNREDYAAEVEGQLADFEETLDTIETDMESSGWDDIGEYRIRLDGLRFRMNEARAQSEELKDTPDSGWPVLYEEMEKTLLDISDDIRDFSDELLPVLPE